MTQTEIERRVEEYKVVLKELGIEQTKRFPSNAQIAFLEKTLARIENSFQHAGLDINDYL